MNLWSSIRDERTTPTMVTANTYRETKGYTNNADILICAVAEATRVTSDDHDDNS
jgi:hypothetical protein